MKGWIKVHREMLSHWIIANADYCKAWLVILLRANHEQAKLLVNDQVVSVRRGQFLTSLHHLADESGMSVQRLRTFLKKLEMDGMIVREATPNWTMVTICNYDNYQGDQQAAGKRPTSIQHAGNNKQEGKEKSKKKEEDTVYLQFLDVFNNLKNSNYRGSEKVKRQFHSRVKEGYRLEDFEVAIKNALLSSWMIDNPQYLTPEFITRADKLDKYINSPEKGTSQRKLAEGWDLSDGEKIVKL